MSVFARRERQCMSQWTIRVVSDVGQYLHIMTHWWDFILVSFFPVECRWIEESLGFPCLFWLAMSIVGMWRVVDCILHYCKHHVLLKNLLSFFGFHQVSPPFFRHFILPAGECQWGESVNDYQQHYIWFVATTDACWSVQHQPPSW